MLPWLEHARARVGPAEAARLNDEGARMTLEELIEEGLREPETDGEVALTIRERQIADLIAEGMTYREIGQHLIISRRTVESHVANVKAKLGVSRRALIVAWVIDHQQHPVGRR
jgi:non-specific serine/threonine protein kinase